MHRIPKTPTTESHTKGASPIQIPPAKKCASKTMWSVCTPPTQKSPGPKAVRYSTIPYPKFENLIPRFKKNARDSSPARIRCRTHRHNASTHPEEDLGAGSPFSRVSPFNEARKASKIAFRNSAPGLRPSPRTPIPLALRNATAAPLATSPAAIHGRHICRSNQPVLQHVLCSRSPFEITFLKTRNPFFKLWVADCRIAASLANSMVAVVLGSASDVTRRPFGLCDVG